MTTHHIVDQHKPYSHPYGDIIYGDGTYANVLRKLTKKEAAEIQKKDVLHLAYLSYHPWEALERVPTIDVNQVKQLRKACEYTCPITKFKHNALVPLMVFTSDIKQLLQPMKDAWWYDMACDQEWSKRSISNINEIEELPDHIGIILGTGYTSMCYPSDGHSSLVVVGMSMDNGDNIVCATKVWHNK